jgi:hypothetical protein
MKNVINRAFMAKKNKFLYGMAILLLATMKKKRKVITNCKMYKYENDKMFFQVVSAEPSFVDRLGRAHFL